MIVGLLIVLTLLTLLLLVVTTATLGRLRMIHPAMVLQGASYQSRYLQALSTISTAEGLLKAGDKQRAEDLLRNELEGCQ